MTIIIYSTVFVHVISHFCRKGFTTTTCLGSIWVLERETSTNKSITVVQLHPKKEEEAFRITDDCESVIFNDRIIGSGACSLLKIHCIRHARTPTLFNPNSQAQIFVTLCSHLIQVLQRIIRQRNSRRQPLRCWRRWNGGGSNGKGFPTAETGS